MGRGAWKDGLVRQIQIGTALERVANALDLPEEFEVMANSWAPALRWMEYGSEKHTAGSIVRLREMVAIAAKAIGRPPDEVNDEHWYATSQEVPDLVARWNKHPFTVYFDGEGKKMDCIFVVCVMRPHGCKLDPTTIKDVSHSYHEVQSKIHPECKAALRELLEVGP